MRSLAMYPSGDETVFNRSRAVVVPYEALEVSSHDLLRFMPCRPTATHTIGTYPSDKFFCLQLC
jgi:hypothetical protein